MLPGGRVWSVLVVWLAAQAGGALISFTGLHPLLGMLLAGVAAENIPVSWLTAPLPASWKSKIRQGALAIIFLRSGLELDWEVFRRAGPAALRLLLVPGVVEALVSGSVAHAVFGMPWLLAYSLGFILKAVGPAIVIQLMFDLQKRGLGVAKGIPALVVAAASFDDLVAILFYTLFINFAVQGATPVGGKAAATSANATGSSLALQLANGPISVLLGFAGGAILAVVAAATRVWSSRRKRTAAVVVLGDFPPLFFSFLMRRQREKERERKRGREREGEKERERKREKKRERENERKREKMKRARKRKRRLSFSPSRQKQKEPERKKLTLFSSSSLQKQKKTLLQPSPTCTPWTTSTTTALGPWEP